MDTKFPFQLSIARPAPAVSSTEHVLHLNEDAALTEYLDSETQALEGTPRELLVFPDCSYWTEFRPNLADGLAPTLLTRTSKLEPRGRKVDATMIATSARTQLSKVCACLTA